VKVLLVAPSQVSLPQSSQEVEAVVNSGLSVRLMQASVSQRDLVSELSVPGKYDVLWLATHGDKDGILLSGEILSPAAITSIIRGSGVKLVFLNTCSSFQMANAIQSEASIDVICTITDVPDIEAYRTGALFAAKLFQTGNFRKSYELSKPGRNSTYVYLSGFEPMLNGDSEFGKLRKSVDELEAAARSHDKVEVHRKSVEITALCQKVDEHSGEIKEIKKRLTIVEEKQSPPFRVFIWRLSAVLTLIIALVSILSEDASGFLFANVWSEAFVAAALVTLAVVFWVLGTLTAERLSENNSE
jgi:hypothetical protein